MFACARRWRGVVVDAADVLFYVRVNLFGWGTWHVLGRESYCRITSVAIVLGLVVPLWVVGCVFA